MKERPTCVTVFAIINMILAALGVIGIIFALISQLGLMPEPPQGNPALELMENNPGYQLFTNIVMGLSVPITILVISASIGMFSLKPWARLTTIGWGLYSLLMTVVGHVLSYLIIFRPLLTDLTGPERIGIIIGVVFGAVFGVVYIGYFLLMIFMLTRPAVVEAFTPEPLESDQDFLDTQSQPGGGDL